MTSPQHLAERALDLGACPLPNYADANSRRRAAVQTALRAQRDRARRLQALIDRATSDLADATLSIGAFEAELAALGAEVDHAG